MADCKPSFLPVSRHLTIPMTVKNGDGPHDGLVLRDGDIVKYLNLDLQVGFKLGACAEDGILDVCIHEAVQHRNYLCNHTKTKNKHTHYALERGQHHLKENLHVGQKCRIGVLIWIYQDENDEMSAKQWNQHTNGAHQSTHLVWDGEAVAADFWDN